LYKMAGVKVVLTCSLLLSFLTDIACSQNCHPLDQCSCKLDNGKIISLWGIDKGSGEGYDLTDALSRGFTYKYSPCSGLKYPKSECNGALVCQTENTDSFAIALNKGPVTTGFDTATLQYIFIYTGTTTKVEKSRITLVNLACDPKATSPSITAVTEKPTGKYSYTVTTKCACPGQCKYSPKPSPSSKSSSKLSIGSILCIVFFVLLIVYIAGGLLINKYARQKEGSEIIPNKDLWTDVPSLIKDGAMFTYQKVTGKKSDYQVIT